MDIQIPFFLIDVIKFVQQNFGYIFVFGEQLFL